MKTRVKIHTKAGWKNVEIDIPVLGKKNLYLIHPRDARQETRAWELEFEKRTGIVLVNPFYDVRGEEAEQNHLGHEKYAHVSADLIVEADLAALTHPRISGAVVLISRDIQKSWGSSMEIFYTKAMLMKRVYTVIEDPRSYHHPWLNAFSDRVFSSKPQLEEFLAQEK